MCKYYDLDIVKNFTIPVNHNYFDNINTEIKAYIIGYIIADGCIRIVKRKNKFSKRLLFCSSIDDSEIIYKIQKEISPKSKITKIHNTKGAKNRKPQLVLRISSDKLIDTLCNKFDIKPNKTLNSKSFGLPILNDEYTIHLIRGIFDGDGTISKYSLSFCLNSKILCADIAQYFLKHIPEINYRIIEVQGKTCMYYRLYINLGKGIRQKLFKLLYDNSEFSLSRKRNKFLELL